MKIRRNDFSNLRQLRASSCWSSSAGRNSTPTHSWISFVEPSNQATTVILSPRPCNLERGKISPDTLHRAPMTFHLVNPFHRFLCLFFVSRIFRFLLIFSTFQHSSKILEGKAVFCTGHERYYNKRENIFTQFYSFLSFALLNTWEIEIENFTHLYYMLEKNVTLFEGTKKIHHFDESK